MKIVSVTSITPFGNSRTVVEKVVTVRLQMISLDAKLPAYQHEGDSGADVYSAVDCVIKASEIVAVSTGLKAEIPQGYELQVRPRSGLALKGGIGVLNSPGTIDSGYRGEIKIILINLGKNPFHIKKGDRIAQLVLCPIYRADYVSVDTVSETHRGTGGFGSTGK